MAEPLSLQGILSRFLPEVGPLSARQALVCRHLLQCRTPSMGGEYWQCEGCGHEYVQYFSCRDRHCPACQHEASRAWVVKQQRQALPVPVFHVVWTLPEGLNRWAMCAPKTVYRCLFRAAWATLSAFAQRRCQGTLGMTAMLHTWGQSLSLHPHLHCLIPAGVWGDDQRWHAHSGTYLFPVRALSRGFRGRMVSALRSALNRGERAPEDAGQVLDALRQQDWVVYARPGTVASDQVIQYLARYTHRTAISESRLVRMNAARVWFRYRDYRDKQHKLMSLAGPEFVRRFIQHILPRGLQRIRHFGFLANTCREKRLAQIRAQLGVPAPDTDNEPDNPAFSHHCPGCGCAHVYCVGPVAPIRLEGG